MFRGQSLICALPLISSRCKHSVWARAEKGWTMQSPGRQCKLQPEHRGRSSLSLAHALSPYTMQRFTESTSRLTFRFTQPAMSCCTSPPPKKKKPFWDPTAWYVENDMTSITDMLPRSFRLIAAPTINRPQKISRLFKRQTASKLEVTLKSFFVQNDRRLLFQGVETRPPWASTHSLMH